MGFNTTVFVLNDGFTDIQKHPEQFVEQISNKMHVGGSAGVGSHANCVQVMPTAHADVFRLYCSQGNLMIDLSPYSSDTVDLISRLPDLVRGSIDRARRQLDMLEERLHHAFCEG